MRSRTARPGLLRNRASRCGKAVSVGLLRLPPDLDTVTRAHLLCWYQAIGSGAEEVAQAVS